MKIIKDQAGQKKKERQAFIAYIHYCTPLDTNMNDLNGLLADGWSVVQISPMGGGGAQDAFASLVILEK